MQGVAQVTVSNAAIFLGFGYDDNLLLVDRQHNQLRNIRRIRLHITGNLTLSTMNITNVDEPGGNRESGSARYPGRPYHGHLCGAAPRAWLRYFRHRQQSTVHRPPGPSSLMIVDASTPSAPVLYPFMTEFGMTDVAAVNGYLLVPNVNGLTIYSIQTP